MTNSQSGKYDTLLVLNNDVVNNSLWQSSIMITPIFGGSGTNQNKGKSQMTQPTFKRPQPTNFGQNNSGSHSSFRGVGSKGCL